MNYPSDLKDQEWEEIRSFLEYTNGYGHRRKHDIRHVLNAILYGLKTGCQWRQLPHDFPKWQTVYTYYRRLCHKGTWETILDHLNRTSRKQAGRTPTPSYVIVDSQSVKTVSSGEERGYDGGKKVKGRKRHIAVDTQGRLLYIEVTAAHVHDTTAGLYVFDAVYDKCPGTLEAFCADAAYQGNAQWYAEGALQKRVDISRKKKGGFQVLPQRWVVERTFAWLGNDRRWSKEYERKVNHSENFIRLSMIKRTAAQMGRSEAPVLH